MPFPRIVYSKDYFVDIGQHVFPTIKYRLIYNKLISESGLGPSDFIEPREASDDEILLVHTRDYVDKVKNGTLSPQEIFTLELPFSKDLARSAYMFVGGTMLTARIALEHGVGVHIGGGFHHAFPDHGEGFCVFNDVAIGVRKMQMENRIKRALIIDCDLHHGNGTAHIFADDKDVFTFSIHQEHNYPFFKPPSDLDVGLRDLAKDSEYMECLKEHIPKIISDHKPELILYVAGADPYSEDIIGNLNLSLEGLKMRDKFVFETAKHFDVPIACVLAGGYARDYNDTVKIHYNTVCIGLGLEGIS